MLQIVPFFCSFFLYLLQMRFLLCNIFCTFLLFCPLFADMFCSSFAKMCVNILFFDVYAVVSFPLFWHSVLVVGWIGQLRVGGFFHSTSFLGNKRLFLRNKGHFLQNKGHFIEYLRSFLQNKGHFLGSLRHFLWNKIVFCRYKINFSDGWEGEECFAVLISVNTSGFLLPRACAYARSDKSFMFFAVTSVTLVFATHRKSVFYAVFLTLVCMIDCVPFLF